MDDARKLCSASKKLEESQRLQLIGHHDSRLIYFFTGKGKQSFEEIVEMSRKGDVKNVDLLVLGICGTWIRIYLHVCVYILCMYGCPTYTASIYAYTCLYLYVKYTCLYI